MGRHLAAKAALCLLCFSAFCLISSFPARAFSQGGPEDVLKKFVRDIDAATTASDLDHAKVLVEQAIHVLPRHPEIRLRYIQTFVALKDYAAVLPMARQLFAEYQSPKNHDEKVYKVRAGYELAHLLIESKQQLSEAVTLLEEAATLSADPRIRCALGYAYLQVERYADAIATLLPVVELPLQLTFPRSLKMIALDNLASAYLSRFDYQQAWKYYLASYRLAEQDTYRQHLFQQLRMTQLVHWIQNDPLTDREVSQLTPLQESVVRIRVVFEQQQTINLGVGFIIPGNLLVTAAHVFRNDTGGEVRRAEAYFSDGKSEALQELLVADADADVVVFKLAAQPERQALISAVASPEVQEDLYYIAPKQFIKNNLLQFIHGTMAESYSSDAIGRQQLHLPTVAGMSGGPIVDATGAVVGLLAGSITNFEFDLFRSRLDHPGRSLMVPISTVRSLLRAPHQQLLTDWLRSGKTVGVLDKIRQLHSKILAKKGTQEAIAALEALKKHYPDHPQLLIALAHGYGNLLNNDINLRQAQEYYEQVINLDPLCQDAYVGMAKLAAYRNQYDTAIAYYEKAEALDSLYLQDRMNKANCFLRVGKVDMALQEVKFILAADPENQDARLMQTQLSQAIASSRPAK